MKEEGREKDNSPPRTTWFTADTHFGHRNIIRYCNRPFASVEEMNQTLIANINERVQPQDTLFHLGDFSMNPDRRDRTNNASFYLEQINCKNIILITGNHDPHYSTGQARVEFARLFKAVYDQLRVKVWNGDVLQEIFLNHYAMRVWNKSHHGVWHLYGHSHGSLPDDPNSLSFDVGVDCHEYKPLNLQQISAIMATKTWRPIDHHGRDEFGDKTIKQGVSEG